jgi:hypothetical protein
MTRPTRFEVQVNGERFAEANVNIEDQVEINLASVAGQDSAVLQVTAFIPNAGKSGHFIYSERAVVESGDTVTIVLNAVGRAALTGIDEPASAVDADDYASAVVCSFCGKNQDEVRKLIAGKGVFICDECVGLCHDAVQEMRGR